MTALVTAAIAIAAAVLASSATALAIPRRPRYVGRHRAPF
ncbi:hypothetical protein ACTIVE_6085 [Actinomadura verrucosospora]|uniref:Uncharacterized protein n=1 Tax=Actinomadura verrucosospora TaxID=46165 RepID=A0A7D3VWI3_ACTVE|nr:hypothetical protein ACTIVE_6085 [Actinomadura verrucosospora]